MSLGSYARVTCLMAMLAAYAQQAEGDELQDATAAMVNANGAIQKEENDATSAQQEYDQDYNTYQTLYESYITWYEPTYGANTNIENALDGAQSALATAKSCLTTWDSDDGAAVSNYNLGVLRYNNADYLYAEFAFNDATSDANKAETDAQGALCALLSAESDLNTAANLLNNP